MNTEDGAGYCWKRTEDGAGYCWKHTEDGVDIAGSTQRMGWILLEEHR